MMAKSFVQLAVLSKALLEVPEGITSRELAILADMFQPRAADIIRLAVAYGIAKRKDFKTVVLADREKAEDIVRIAELFVPENLKDTKAYEYAYRILNSLWDTGRPYQIAVKNGMRKATIYRHVRKMVYYGLVSWHNYSPDAKIPGARAKLKITKLGDELLRLMHKHKDLIMLNRVMDYHEVRGV